jgi:hypothetical protein
MSRNLTVNTLAQRKWTPSPEMAIREEEDETAPQRKQQHFIEEEDEEEEEEEDDEEEDEEDEDSAFTSSPSIPDENINFDLVYTLHSFEATVDGQASVKKGDALTLLDDSNSYWWLIRDLKSSEVGYIPAENIETPFERLARLNKHRNVEVKNIYNIIKIIFIETNSVQLIMVLVDFNGAGSILYKQRRKEEGKTQSKSRLVYFTSRSGTNLTYRR